MVFVCLFVCLSVSLLACLFVVVVVCCLRGVFWLRQLHLEVAKHLCSGDHRQGWAEHQGAASFSRQWCAVEIHHCPKFKVMNPDSSKYLLRFGVWMVCFWGPNTEPQEVFGCLGNFV